MNAFDQNNDRLALLTFSDGSKVLDPMPASRGFNKAGMISLVPGLRPGGSTSPDFNSAQLEGKYYHAQTAADVGPAFQALQNQI